MVDKNMKMDDKYIDAFNNMDNLIKRRLENEKYPALGYTSNLDILCDFQIEIFNKLLDKHMWGLELSKMTNKKTIKTLKDFLSTVVSFCKKGLGGEVDIEDFSILGPLFDTKSGMGGTGAQAALALAAIDCHSILHLTDDSKEVCEILESPYVFVINQRGEMNHTDTISQSNAQEVHYIIQYKKGDIIRLGSEEIIIPASNRIIITKVTVNAIMPFDDSYFDFIEDNAMNITSNVISSFNCISNKKILQDRLNYVKIHIKKYKNGNTHGLVFFEDAHYHDDEIRKMCLETIYSQIDIVSLNEEELVYTLEMCDQSIDIDDIISCVEGMKFIKTTYQIQKGVIVHTKDYSMYVGDKLNADIEGGLIYGNLLATAKAMSGCYGNKGQIRKVLNLPNSEKGIINRKIIEKSIFNNEVIIVPTKYIDKPKYTIGLGDSFVAGVQICFI